MQPSAKRGKMDSQCQAGENTVESRFLEPSIPQTSQFLEPIFVSLIHNSLELYFRFLEPPDFLNQFLFPLEVRENGILL